MSWKIAQGKICTHLWQLHKAPWPGPAVQNCPKATAIQVERLDGGACRLLDHMDGDIHALPVPGLNLQLAETVDDGLVAVWRPQLPGRVMLDHVPRRTGAVIHNNLNDAADGGKVFVLQPPKDRAELCVSGAVPIAELRTGPYGFVVPLDRHTVGYVHPLERVVERVVYGLLVE